MEIDSAHNPAQHGHDDIYPPDMSNRHERPLPGTDTNTDIHALMLHYQVYLRGRCRILVRGNRDEANDLFSQVMLKVCSEPPDRLRQIRHLGGWLSRIAHNQFIDAQRERQAQERRDDNLCYLYETIGYQAPSPEQALLNGELDHYIRQAFDSLPERLRQAAHMRFYEGAPYEEIATDLSISEANARKRIQEARKILTAFLRTYIDGHRPSDGNRSSTRPVAGPHAKPDID